MATTYENFHEFAQAVQSMHLANPELARLNGNEAGGDQNAWSYFKHAGKTWKVDADSHVLPILVAHEFFQRTGADPFRLSSTPKRDKLIVVDAVQAELVRRNATYQDHQHLYVYSHREN